MPTSNFFNSLSIKSLSVVSYIKSIAYCLLNIFKA
nr:MAG TPA: hypothetical protein [Caudoviricetes sp.]